MHTYIIESIDGVFRYNADDADHAIEQHQAVYDDDQIIEVVRWIPAGDGYSIQEHDNV